MLKVSDIETSYDSIRALHGVSFEVRQGEIVALLGPNGAGKTTILKTIMRLLPHQRKEQPEKGTVEFLGKRIHRLQTHEIAGMGIAYLPEGREIFPELTVEEHILLGAYLRKDRAEIKKDAEHIFRIFPVLQERKDRQAGYLSGGEQQLLAVGRALMGRPRLLMLDEPSLGLSPLLANEIFTLLRDINRNEGMTILLSEQNARLALKFAHYAVIMESGRIVRACRPDALGGDEGLKEFYLGAAKKPLADSPPE